MDYASYKGILYVGQSGTSGYASAAKGYVLDLVKKTKVNFFPLHFDNTHELDTLSDNDKIIQDITNLNWSSEDFDLVIFHCTPDLWSSLYYKHPELRGLVKNKKIIGRTVWEYEPYYYKWVDFCNHSFLTYVSVPSKMNRDVFLKSGVKTEILVEPHLKIENVSASPCIRKVVEVSDNTFIFTNNDKLHALDRLDQNCVFYTINEWNQRKNMEMVLRGFCETFSYTDNASLILKTFISGNESQHVKILNRICNILNKHYDTFPDIYVICGALSETEIRTLHHSCECYINLSVGEGFSLGTFDAFNSGNYIITNNFGGQMDYIGDSYEGTIRSEKIKITDEKILEKFPNQELFGYQPDFSEYKKRLRYFFDKYNKLNNSL